jgi:hypothetical protein
MAKFHFSFCVRPNETSYFYQQVEFEDVEGGVQISCNEPDSECVHLLAPKKYKAFLERIGQPADMDIIEATRFAVKRNKRPLVFDAVHELAEVKFTWYDWDSSFYGDKGVVVSDVPQFDPPKKLFFSMLSDYEKLSEIDKERFIADLAQKFFPEEKERGV